MHKHILAALFVIAFPLSALAQSSPQWAIQVPGQSVCTMYNSGSATAPTPDGQSIPIGSSVAAWQYFNGDNEVKHYSIVNGNLLYNVGSLQIPASLSGITDILRNDSAISAAGRLELMRMRSFLFEDFYNSPNTTTYATLKSRWSQLKNADTAISAADATQAASDFVSAGLPVQ